MRLASKEVKRLLAQGDRATQSNDGLRLSARSTKGDNKSSRLALAVPKKQYPRAVDRNRAKRILRESFRHHALREQGLDLFVTLFAAPKRVRPGRVLRATAEALFGKLSRRGR